jgi:5-amino-6-(5-phospho-D-ribitylamino)uracil phosphatase
MPTPKPDISLIAIDLDGTLLDDAKQISPRTISALSALNNRNIKIIIASARPPRSVRHLYKQLSLDTWQINYNGALIWDEIARKTIFHRPMPGVLARQIIDLARRRYPQTLVTCEILDRWFTDRFDQSHTTETGRLFKPDVIAPLDDFCNQEITKLLLLAEPKIVGEIESLLVRTFAGKVAIVRTDPNLIQIMDAQVSKAAALQIVADHYQTPMKNALAIGDAPNDIDMLKLAGISVAMQNASDAVKKVADWIAPSNNDDGVFAALKHYGLLD